MGKCVSKQSSALTIALTERDLATAARLWSKFCESPEYVAFTDLHGNHLFSHLTFNDRLSGGGEAKAIEWPQIERHPSRDELKKGGSAKQRNTVQCDNREANGASDAGAEETDITNNIHNNNNNDFSTDRSQFLLHLRLHHQQKPLPTEANTNDATPPAAHLGVKKQHRLVEEDGQELVGEEAKCPNCSADHHDLHRREPYSVGSQGQTESKKSTKKQNVNGVQTKGTAMSFGFRKKLNTTPKKLRKFIDKADSKDNKKQDKCNNVHKELTAGGGGMAAKTVADTNLMTCPAADAELVKDDNGNTDLLTKVHFDKVGAGAVNAGRSAQQANQGQPDEQPALPGVGNRFGYRGGNVVRPSSTDITARCQREAHDNIDNNNWSGAGHPRGVLVSNLKRRSKSAHAGRAPCSSNESDSEGGRAREGDGGAGAGPKITQPKTITFNLNQNSTIEYDRRQFFLQPSPQPQPQSQPQSQPPPLSTTSTCIRRSVQSNVINAGQHTNVIVRPTARLPTTTTAAAYSKFTLQTVSLPKPEFAVAISLSATTPTTPTNSTAAATPLAPPGTRKDQLLAGRPSAYGQHPLTLTQSGPAIGQAVDQKTAKQMANSTRRTFCGSREISADSGIASLDMALEQPGGGGGASGGVSGVGGRKPSPKRNRSRPRNLQMVMSGRHKFEVRDLDESLSSESTSCVVEPLALPKLPSESQTVPLPLSGLVRSNTVLSRESYELRNAAAQQRPIDNSSSEMDNSNSSGPAQRSASEEDSESVEEQKLHLDRSTTEKGVKERQFRDINTCSSKTSSPGSSVMSSWCNAGESLAVKDCSSLSLSTSSCEDSNRQTHNNTISEQAEQKKPPLRSPEDDDDEDRSALNTDLQISAISSLTGPASLNTTDQTDNGQRGLITDRTLAPNGHELDGADRPKSLCNALNENKFAEMALAGSTFLLDDETSPTDSLVSSSEESEEAVSKQKKHKINEELQEKDIDEISPELELVSSLSPGTPTHASHSLSLSDCGNLIDDEIADQPALLFNQEATPEGGAGRGDAAENCVPTHKDKTDTPTLMESLSSMGVSGRSQGRSRSALQQAMELSLRTPLSLRKAVMERAESLDTLSPCESICSDDLMMDFDINSSMDSIDRSTSIKSRSGSDLNRINDDDDAELLALLERNSSDVMKELNTIMRAHTNKQSEKDITAHLPARATRLLNRSRLQQHCTLNNADSDSSGRRTANTASPRASITSSPANIKNSNSNSNSNNNSTCNSANSSLRRSCHPNQQAHPHPPHHHQHHPHHQPQSRLHQRDTHCSSDDLMLYDKSFRNAMIHDVLQFKKQLLRLRRILQENEDCLTRTETLNPFESDNGKFFASCGLDGGKLLDNIDLAELPTSIADDPTQELTDLRRQVVYLQGQVDDRDRTIRLQRNRIEQLEADKLKPPPPTAFVKEGAKECINMATQTERARLLTIGPEGLSRSKPEYTSYTTHFPALCSDSTTIIEHHQQYPGHKGGAATNQTRRHTIISTTLTNYSHQLAVATAPPVPPSPSASAPVSTPRRAPVAWERQAPTTYKPVKITLIGEPLKHWGEGGSKKVDNDEEKLAQKLFRCSLQPTHLHRQQQSPDLIINDKESGSHEASGLMNGDSGGSGKQHVQNWVSNKMRFPQKPLQHHHPQQAQHFFQAQHQQRSALTPTVTIV